MNDVNHLALLGLAFLLSSVIGLERELRQKSAGLRTHTLVGVGAALFMLVSKFGFTDVVSTGTVELDPSRIAAQVVSGIGFIGAGLIFVRRHDVRGLTTAASIWLTAAIGLAAGAGLVVLAVAGTAVHLAVAYVYTPLVRRLPPSKWSTTSVEVHYRDGEGVLRRLLAATTDLGCAVSELGSSRGAEGSLVTVTFDAEGPHESEDLVRAIQRVEGVVDVTLGGRAD